MQPERIGKFEILAELGAGGMGVVYRARDTRLRREVALKLIRADRAPSRFLRTRFLHECRAAAALNHPGIATLFEADETESGELYFAAELVTGETLNRRQARQPFSTDELLTLGHQLAEALAAAHAENIVHRDIKPSNLMITSAGSLKVLDFGLARLDNGFDPPAEHGGVVETRSRTAVGMILGTPAYMSPEQAGGQGAHASADVFSAGAVLYEMATGQLAFGATSPHESMRRVLAEEPTPISNLSPTVPADLVALIERCLIKDADRRPSAAELAFGLGALRAQSAAGMKLPVGRTRRRGRILRGLAWGAGVAMLAVVGIVALKGTREPALAFGQRDRVLIADVDNQTGEPVFDLALRTALEVDLQQSPYVTVYDRNQVRRTLALMRRSDAVTLDEELGREVCLFADVKALIVPRILSVGEAYELHVILVEPGSGRHVDTMRATAVGREEVLLHGVDELTAQLRSQLGESLSSIEETDRPTSDVTTGSWEALRSMTLAHRNWAEGRSEQARALFEQALEEDPDFTAARGSLGLLLIQFLNEPERGRQLLREALAGSEGVSKRERLMLQAVHHQFVEQDPEHALHDYALILELYPDMSPARNNRGQILAELGRYEEAVREYELATELDPLDAFPLGGLYWAYLSGLRDPVGAESAARRGLALLPDSPFFGNMLAWSLVAQRRMEDAEVAMTRTLELDPSHPRALVNRAHVLLALDRAEEALVAYERAADAELLETSWYATYRGMTLNRLGRNAEASRLAGAEIDRLIASGGEPSVPDEMINLARLEVVRGDIEQARDYLERASATGELDNTTNLAMTYAMLGDKENAIQNLAGAFRGGYWDRYFPALDPTYALLHDDPDFLALIDER